MPKELDTRPAGESGCLDEAFAEYLGVAGSVGPDTAGTAEDDAGHGRSAELQRGHRRLSGRMCSQSQGVQQLGVFVGVSSPRAYRSRAGG